MRRTVRKIFIILLSLAISLFAESGGKEDSIPDLGLIYGEKYVFFIKTPEGWELDDSSGVNQELQAIIYPKGGSWEKSPTVMYVRGIDIETTLTLKDFIETEIEGFRKDFPEIKIEELDSILIEKEEQVAKVVKFSGGGYRYIDVVAYIKEEKNISILTITTEIPVELDICYSKFIELVQSYKHVEDYKAVKEKYGLD